jgi:type I restriction enzyme S subunit
MGTSTSQLRVASAQHPGKPGYKRTKLGWVPEDWEVLPLSKLSERIMVGIASAATHAYREKGVLLLRNQNILEGTIDERDVLYIDETYEHLHRNKRLRTGDVITMRTGYPGVSAVVPEHLAGTQCFTSLITRPVSSKLDSHYLAYYNNSPIGKKIISGLEIGGAQKNFNSGSLEKLPVITPPLPEQRRIAVVLGVWDRAIATVQQMLAAQQERKQGLMQELLIGRRRFPGFEPNGGTQYVRSKIGLVPGDWQVIHAGDAFRNVSERGTGGDLLAVTQDQGIVRREDMDRRVVMPEGSTDGYKAVAPGDFVISLRTFQGGIEWSSVAGLVSPAYTVLRLKDKNFLPEFVALYLKSYVFIQRLSNAVVGIRDGKNISFPDFKIQHLPQPSLEEQRMIASAINAAEYELKELADQLLNLTNQKRGLMQQLLTGAVRVNH